MTTTSQIDEPQAPNRTRVRILTLNAWSEDRGAGRAARVRDAINALNPDLVGLQEVDQTGGKAAFAAVCAGSPLHWFHSDAFDLDEAWGIAIGSRWRPLSVTAHELPCSERGPVMLSAVVPLPIGAELLFLNAKPSWKFAAEADRVAQALALADHEASNRRLAHTVVTGDFDAEPDHDSIRFLTGKSVASGQSAHFRDAWTHAGDDGPGHTWTTENKWVKDTYASGETVQAAPSPCGYGGPTGSRPWPSGWVQVPHGRRIDYVLLGSTENHPHVLNTILSCHVVMTDDPAPSDHYGVLTEVEFTSRLVNTQQPTQMREQLP